MSHTLHTRLADEEYHTLALLVGEHSGICLGAAAREAVCTRARQQMHEHGCRRFGDYLDRLQHDRAHTLLADLCAPLHCRAPRLFAGSAVRCDA